MLKKTTTNTVSTWLGYAQETLRKVGIDSARLDCLILLEDELGKDRSWLLAHPHHELEDSQRDVLDARLLRRENREPLAYIRGFREFYGKAFSVTKDTLIPRPESEEMINLLKQYRQPHMQSLIDIGTGSGVLGITAGLECQGLNVTLNDISSSALKVAQSNARKYKLPYRLQEADFHDVRLSPFHITLANLPYVASSDPVSPETQFEPSVALFADNNGLELIEDLVGQWSQQVSSGALLFVEANPPQHKKLITTANMGKAKLLARRGFILVFQL